jgi:hypothetical protein
LGQPNINKLSFKEREISDKRKKIDAFLQKTALRKSSIGVKLTNAYDVDKL